MILVTAHDIHLREYPTTQFFLKKDSISSISRKESEHDDVP